MAVSQGWSELMGVGFDGEGKILQNKATLK
jgi:hypothetical protein